MDYLLEIHDKLITILKNANGIENPDEEVWLLRRSIQVVLEDIEEAILLWDQNTTRIPE